MPDTHKFDVQSPRSALNKAYLKLKPARNDIDRFKTNLANLLKKAQKAESEEYHKNLVATFLRDTFYGDSNFINTKQNTDLVIHNGAEPSSTVGVLIEAKRPTNKAEMVSKTNLNTKSFQELVLYYLRERFASGGGNLEIKHLVITNAFEWFVFDAAVFEHNFAQNSKVISKFQDFQQGRLSSTSTDFFYKEIAAPAINLMEGEVAFAYFDVRHHENDLDLVSRQNEAQIVALYKLLSPQHLLKLPFINDSNTLHRGFYSELLHIIGLAELKDGAKRLIGRKDTGKRDSASLLENAFLQLDTLDKIQRISNPARFGATTEEKLFAVALELVLTWINRILFLKLIEGQLSLYAKGASYKKSLNVSSIPSFDSLNGIFFQVLARPLADRNESVIERFAHIPYLNSSLFEPTELEHEAIFISALDDGRHLPIYAGTVLKDVKGKKRTGSMSTLEYLFGFLDAYDFASDASADSVQEDNKTLINASVLGLIFEKINGYKDGSFFTPGFITMHIARDLVRRAVVARFNDVKGWSCKTIPDVYDRISVSERKEANAILNSLRICDPAVGSGHFLVSVLNELLAVKAELKILQDRNGTRLKEYQFQVENDELLITDEDGEFFNYSRAHKESQRVQEAIFHEKQTLIEGCLFGVDINPNSVNICRLRLWIELLKHSYFRADGQLETLPNIDINIKCGNSLVSRFDMASDLRQVLKRKKLRISDYRAAVNKYQNADTKEEKREVQRLIDTLKGDFRSEIFDNDPMVRRLRLAEAELRTSENQQTLFEENADKKMAKVNREAELKNEIQRLFKEIETIKSNRIFENSFEWRFEFPEVLDDDGKFLGFDLVVGNPPYGVSIKGPERKYLSRSLGKVPDYEIYYWFVALARAVLRENGVLGFIIPNTFLFNVNAASFRLSLFSNWQVEEVLDCTDFPIFGDAVVRNAVVTLSKSPNGSTLGYRRTAAATSFSQLVERPLLLVERDVVEMDNHNWGLLFRNDQAVLEIIRKLRSYPQLQEQFESSQGYIPYRQSDLAKIYGKEEGKRMVEQRVWHSDARVSEEYIEEIFGRSLSRYAHSGSGNYVRYGKHVASYVDMRFFSNKRLLVREITNPVILASIVDSVFINDPQIISVIEKKESLLSIEFLWALLNSKVATFFHFNGSPKATKGLFPKILVQDIRQFPLPPVVEASQQMKIEQLVSEAFKNPSKRPKIEAQIDALVVKLYQLSDAEKGVLNEDLAVRLNGSPAEDLSVAV